MRLAVLSSANSWYAQDLQRAAGNAHTVEPLPFTRIHASLEPDEAGNAVSSAEVPLADFDAMLVRTMPPGSLEQVVFRMDALQRMEAQGMPVFNSSRSIETAVDKYLTLARLRAAGFDIPRTHVSQTFEEAMEGFSKLGGDVVLKPLFGSEGRGISRIHDPAIAERTFKLLIQLGAIIYQQEFIEHEGHDLRLLVLGENVFGMKRSNPLDWRTNVSLGARAEPLEVTPRLAELAIRAANCVDAVMAGVDLLPARDGRLLALEVNAVPGWRALSRTLDVDIAAEILRLIRNLAEEKQQ